MRIHPFEIITIGGDDLMLIVPADKAIPLAAAISQRFQTRMQALLAAQPLPAALKEHAYTLSGGVVLASDHNPIRVLRDLAHELQDLAKAARQAAHRGPGDEGYLDFMVLKSADMLERDISQLRQHYPYTLRSPSKDLSLVGRPYRASQLLALWQALVALREANFATSQLENLAAALLKGRWEATLYYLYQQARDRKGQYAKLAAALAAVQAHGVADPPPWVRWTGPHARYSHKTALWDIAELYRFVGRSDDGNRT